MFLMKGQGIKLRTHCGRESVGTSILEEEGCKRGVREVGGGRCVRRDLAGFKVCQHRGRNTVGRLEIGAVNNLDGG